MIVLKEYQNYVLEEFEKYLDQIQKQKKINVKNAYQDAFKLQKTADSRENKYFGHGLESPNVCIRIPTGGGKTLIACHVLRLIYRKICV